MPMKEENYWSLVIESGLLQAGIWNISDSTVNILSLGKPHEWSDHELVEVADTSLSEAARNFPDEGKEPSKTVFGVSPYWVEEGQIKKEHLEKVRKICVDLSLSPSGFVVIPEAIAHGVKIQEGSPLSGVIVGVSDKMIDVSLFKFGNLVGTVNVGKSVSIVDDIVEGLVRFSVKDSLPTRLVLYGVSQKELQSIKQDLISTEWSDKADGKIKFLHIPQVEIVEDDEKLIAVAIAGASEMQEIKSVKLLGHVVLRNKEESVEAPTEESSNVSPTHDLTAQDIGFVVDQEEPVDIAPSVKEPTEHSFARSDISEEPALFKPKSNKFKLPKMPSFHFGLGKGIFLVVILLLILATSGVGAAWWYMPKAEIAVFVSPKSLGEQKDILLDENISEVDQENLVFPVKKVTTEVSSSKSKGTTGKRVVGEKSKGSVTIRNGTSQGIAFPKGTALLNSGDLKFVLDEGASVSAALSPSEPGSITVSVTAFDIGSQYNLAKDESMSISNYPKSEVDGIVSSGLSGGSSKEIVAVSQADLSSLKEELRDELERQGLADLEGQATSGRVITDSLDSTIKNSDFSADVGDEASSINLEMRIEVTALVIDNSIVESMASTILANQIPQGFSLKENQIEVVFDLSSESDGQYETNVNLTAKLLPEVSTDEIKDKVAGKLPTDAQKYLETIPGFNSAEVSIRPRFPGRLGLIPFIKKNISVDIVAER